MRSLTGTLRTAIDTPDGFYALAKATVWPSRAFFSVLTSDFAITGADALGVVNNPLRQDIEYSAVDDGLVTFWGDTNLKYAIQGSSTITTCTYTTDVKPGVLGSKIFIYDGTNVDRYTINWSSIQSRSTTPLTDDVQQVTPALTVHAVHAISDTEAVLICEDNGGFTAVYVSGTTQYTSTLRFMFPKRIDWAESSRTMKEMAVFSGALKLDNKIFVYMSNASMGTVDGMYYDTQTGEWSDTFIALPTDLEVSLCEFRISNAYERNGTAFLCGQFIRTDIYEGGQPYSLILASTNGKTFSIDRFTLVSDIGYRFLARVGSDNELYLGNSNRVCFTPVTWVFDGVNGTNGVKVDLTESHIKSVSDTDLNRLTMEFKSGAEDYFDSTSIVEGARVQLYVGAKSTVGDEYVLWGTYIINKLSYGLAVGKRAMSAECINESLWRLTGLSMPFYAEIFGKSCLFDPMTETSGNLYSAPSGNYTETKFQVDFWKHEPYSNTSESITGINMLGGGGVDYKETTGVHKYGIILSQDVKDVLDLTENPKITNSTVNVKIYGWCHPLLTGQNNDQIDVVIQTEDEDGNVTGEIVTNAGKKWKQTWPDTVAGEEPISIAVSGLTVGERIKRIGVVFWNSTNGSWFNVGRVEVVDNVEIPFAYDEANTPWTVEDDGTFSVPSSGRPFIMFSQKPYNAWNFTQSAFFENTVTGGITGYATAGGLIGHAQDASNYTLARYDKTANKAEIVVCRNGLETVLVSTTPGFTIANAHGVQFRHKDGMFYLDMWNDTNERFENVTSYKWTASDGFMYTSATSTMKCGIYGTISAPRVRILGYYAGDSESSSNADGMPIDPLYDITDFPASGSLRIGDNVYTYTSKIAHPTICRGPYQFRQGNIYTPPYGNGLPGLECRDFDWNASASLINGKLIAINSGANFIAAGALWQIFTTTGGATNWHRNRARFYSNNSQISEIFHTLANKVWVVGGFGGVSLDEGTALKEREGKMAVLELAGSIKCYWYSGSGGRDDTTIADLINEISLLSGASAEFSGDYENASLSVSGVTDVFQDNYADGFDMHYKIASPTTHEIQTNIKIDSTNYENGPDFATDTGCKLVVTSAGGGVFNLQVISTPSATQIAALQYNAGTSVMKMRVLFHSDFLTVFQNGRWVTTFCFDGLIYDQTNYINIDASGTFTMTDILIRELGDWREAIYIDLETDGRSAIGSVIQERPVEINALPNGGVDYVYNPTRSQVTAVRSPRQHTYDKLFPVDGASDAIIYGSKEVKTMQDANFAQDLGFATKLMRVPNLNVGAIEATQIMLTKMHEARNTHNLTIRPDFALSPGDIYAIDYTTFGTGRNEVHDIITESVTLDISMVNKNRRSVMTVRGREQ